jgi:hypothetical protein
MPSIIEAMVNGEIIAIYLRTPPSRPIHRAWLRRKKHKSMEWKVEFIRFMAGWGWSREVFWEMLLYLSWALAAEGSSFTEESSRKLSQSMSWSCYCIRYLNNCKHDTRQSLHNSDKISSSSINMLPKSFAFVGSAVRNIKNFHVPKS